MAHHDPTRTTRTRWWRGTTLEDVAGGRDNNLNLIRAVAALAVLVSHANPISGTPVEPLEEVLGISLGTAAVYVFFGISGFLIARSYDRSRSVGRWVKARSLRIFPGLAVVLALTVLVLGPMVTTLPLAEYSTSSDAVMYIPRNLTLISMQYELPGVLQDNPRGGAINGSLWTLFYEIACYVGVLVIATIGLLHRRGWFVASVCAFVAVFLVVVSREPDVPYRVDRMAHLALPFVIGVVLYVFQASVRLSWAIGALAAAVAVALHDTLLFELAFGVALVYWTFLLGYLVGGRVRRYNALGDYSYGIYIYAFPVQQLVAHYTGPTAPHVNIAWALGPTLVLAVLSWHLVESPALDLARRRPALPSPPRAARRTSLR